MPLGSRDTYTSGDNGSTYTPVPNPGGNPTTISDVYTKSESDTKYQAKADFDRWNRVITIGTDNRFYQLAMVGTEVVGVHVKHLMHWALNVQPWNQPLVFGWMDDSYVKQTVFWIRSSRDTPLPLVLERNDGNPASYSIAQRQSDGTMYWYHFDSPHRNITGYKVLANGQTSNTYWVPDGLGGRPLLQLQAYGTIQVSVRGYRWIIEGDIEGVKQVNYLTNFSVVDVGSGGISQVDGTKGIKRLRAGNGISLSSDTDKTTIIATDPILLALREAAVELLNSTSNTTLGLYSYNTARGFYELCHCRNPKFAYTMPVDTVWPFISPVRLGIDLVYAKSLQDATPITNAYTVQCKTSTTTCLIWVAVSKVAGVKVVFTNVNGNTTYSEIYWGGSTTNDLIPASYLENGNRMLLRLPTSSLFYLYYTSGVIYIRAPFILTTEPFTSSTY